MNNSDKASQLRQLALDITAQNICPDLASGATQLVFGDGNVDAEIVFVGEAPGKNEDLQGRPFVGAAGKFLDEMLGSIKLKRNDIYITNIVKYRPLNNRDPLPEEKQAFWPFLQAQLAIIRPKIIATLGRHSLNCFLPKLQIGQCHGQPKRVTWQYLGQQAGSSSSIVILPLFHPAAALYNGGMRQTLIDDFAKIPSLLKLIDKT